MRLVALLLLVPASAAAQTRAPADVRQDIMQLGDTAELRRIERTHARATDPIDAFTAGFAALRLTDLTEKRTHARRARGYFDRIADREPSNAWAHYGYALSFRADIEHIPGPFEIVTESNAFAVLGIDARSRARRALERAVRLDPTLPGALELLARYANETRDTAALLQARAALNEAHAQGRATEGEVVALAATTRQLRDYEAAAEIAREFTATETPSPAVLLELARALVHVPDQKRAAGAAYLRASSLADSIVLTRMWDDAELLARQHEHDAWEGAGVEERGELLRRFWDLRAALAGIRVEERIAEHYRRLDHAVVYYPRRGMYGATSSNALELQKINDQFDDRGVIYIRHGAPRDVIRTAVGIGTRFGGTIMVPWESWAYFRDTGESMIYHFARFPSDYAEPNLSGGNLMSAGGTLDYVLVKNVDCGVVDYRHLEYDRRLTTLERRCDAMKRLAVGALVRRDARVGLRTESALPPIAVELPFHYDYYTFRGTNDQTDIVAAIGVPLNRERALRLALTVADTGTAAVARAEALTPSVAPSAGQSGMLRTHLTVQAAPTKQALHRISLFDADDERAGKMYGGPMEIRGYRGDTLMVSDVVIADPGEHGAFRRGDLSFTLSPTQVFPRGEFRVFYEIYNLAPRATYRTEISVQSADRGVRGALKRLFGKEEPVVLAFSGVAPDVMSENVLQEVRAVQAPLPPGTYQLKVSITAEGVRRPLVRERRFTIVE